MMKRLFPIIRNALALLGLMTLLGAGLTYSLLIVKTGLSPVGLGEKIFQKGLSIILPVKMVAQIKPTVIPDQFHPVALSPHVSTAQVNEGIVYNRRILRVGPERELKVPSEAAKIAIENDIIEIDAGSVYTGDVALWKESNLTIRGVGGRAILDAGGKAYEQKAIWVIRANHVFIENIGFKNCKVSDKNGAGIRLEGGSLKVRNCLFWENENGILVSGSKEANSEVIVQYSEFAFNGHGDGQSHGIYVGAIENFIFEFNYVHHTKIGHHVKSRARFNKIANNLLTDHETGNSSFTIDLEDGGDAAIIGNVFYKGKLSENSSFIHYGMPNSKSGKPFYIVNNTAISDRSNGILVLNHSPAEGLIFNNLLVGKIEKSVGNNSADSNLSVSVACFSPSFENDYALSSNCEAINTGKTINKINGVELLPQFEYIHPLSKKLRSINGPIDIGAYEYQPE